ncbi:conserved hypothetical protein [Methylocella tundrae]|uniref:Peptidase C39-like domain-containing protein n=1 Tax=Methylocella tundrae TaxID=227605 RepID=A0A8B6M957_METTU|nr:C39 family peptidase [Methylocella tundrae]VTZ51011.1 conserved hypothetical protein [Methylocella tundrae]
MASFELPNGDGQNFLTNSNGERVVWLHVGSQILMDFVTPAGASSPDRRNVVSPLPSVSVAVTARSTAKLSFSIKASAAQALTLEGHDANGDIKAKLAVFAGDFKNQPGMEIDLLANACRGSDPVKIAKIQHLLMGFDDNIFDQNNSANKKKFGPMMCGAVAKGRSQELFGDTSLLLYEKPYHEPLDAVTERYDVKYKSDTIARVRLAIKALLAKGVPVRVGVLDSPVGMHVEHHKIIAWYAGGHTVVIVGCDKSASEFLYIDPWGGGSKMKYEGGIAGAAPSVECPYMGIFIAQSNGTRRVEAVDTDEPNVLVQKWTTYGSFSSVGGNYLEIVSGPPI